MTDEDVGAVELDDICIDVRYRHSEMCCRHSETSVHTIPAVMHPFRTSDVSFTWNKTATRHVLKLVL